MLTIENSFPTKLQVSRPGVVIICPRQIYSEGIFFFPKITNDHEARASFQFSIPVSVRLLVEWAHDLPHITLFGYSMQIQSLYTEIILTQITQGSMHTELWKDLTPLFSFFALQAQLQTPFFSWIIKIMFHDVQMGLLWRPVSSWTLPWTDCIPPHAFRAVLLIQNVKKKKCAWF